MRIILLLLSATTLLSGCAGTARPMRVSIDPTPISSDTATAILYYPATAKQGPLTTYRILIDGKEAGSLIAEKPLRIALHPGRHVLEGKLAGVKSQPAEAHFEAGRVYYFKVRKDFGIVMDTVHVDPAPPLADYSIISFRP